MNSKERILAAIKFKEVDYVPMNIPWNPRPAEGFTWNNEREYLEIEKKMGLDSTVGLYAGISMPPEVKVLHKVIEDGQNKILHQTWETPAATLTEQILLTDDFEDYNGERHLGMLSDFRTSRYIEYPFKEEKDLEALKYIFPEDNPADEEYIKNSYESRKNLAAEFGCILMPYVSAGLDWLIWLYKAEEAVFRTVDHPEFIEKLLEPINKAYYKRMEMALNMGVDAIMRRGWYESADFWSPEIYERFAMPALKKEIDMCHEAGVPYVYIMDSGIKPLLPQLAALGIDCIQGADPVLGGTDISTLRAALPKTAIWGGLSGPAQFGADSPEPIEKAVEEAIEKTGKKGLILGMAVGYREYFPFSNYLAADKVWRKLR